MAEPKLYFISGIINPLFVCLAHNRADILLIAHFAAKYPRIIEIMRNVH